MRVSPFVTIIDDPDGEKRSLMLRSPCVCNGDANGVRCRHYWYMFQKFRAANADTVRDGIKRRACMLTPGFVLEFDELEAPTRCPHYDPLPEPGLVNIVRRAAARLVGRAPQRGLLPNDRKTSTWGFSPRDARFEDYVPMTLEEVRALREKFPDDPKRWSNGKRIDQLSVSDIMSGPQIGIVKPGEVAPGGLSDETAKAVDGLFGEADSGGILKQ